MATTPHPAGERARQPPVTGWRLDLVIATALVAGLSVLTGEQLGRYLPFNPVDRGNDISGWWLAGRSLLEGTHQFLPYHGRLNEFFYPAPYLALLLPLALVSAQATADISRVATALGLVWVIGGWSRTRPGGLRLAWLLGLSLPVVTAVYLGQVPSTLGLVAMSVAIWAQRRDMWVLVGLAVAVGGLRVANALPVITILVIGGWGRWRQLAVAGAVALAALVPATVVITYWYPSWFVDYIGFLNNYRYGGPALARQVLGTPGPLLLELLACALAGYWSRRDVGKPLDLDRAAVALALGAVLGPVSAPYAAMVLIPGLIRLAFRPGMWPLLPLATAVPWLTVLSPFGGGLGADVLGPAVGIVFGLTTIPFLLLRPEPSVHEAAPA